MFKKRLYLAKTIRKAKNHGSKGIHIHVYFKKMALFQFLPAHYFSDYGFKPNGANAYVIAHVFSSERKPIEEMANKNMLSKYYSYSPEENTHIYLKEIEDNPDIMEREAYNELSNVYGIDGKQLRKAEFEVLGEKENSDNG
jgi:hypothetical protein